MDKMLIPIFYDWVWENHVDIWKIIYLIFDILDPQLLYIFKLFKWGQLNIKYILIFIGVGKILI